jgi:signal transduction histidine kinase
MEYKPTELNLKNVFSKVISIANISAQKKKIRTSCKTDEDLFVHADSMMLETILRNLIANSIKFTTDGGEILIDGIISDGKALIKVQDSGIGMTEEVQRKLFKIEEHHTTLGTEGEKGTGLGLVLCKDLVEKNKGKIWVESELRKGSTFFFTLPTEVNLNK